MINAPAALRVISGVGAKGPACFLLETAGKRLMLDLGEGPPPGLLPEVGGIGPVDALVLSHGHKDHVGALSLLPKLGNPPVYATDIVARSLPQGFAVRALPVGGTADVQGVPVITGRNGHAPGGIWLRFEAGAGFIYSGDISAESMLYAYDPPPAAATALLDCSYAGYDKTLADCWAALAPLLEHDAVLLPVPANGRGPEMALAIARHGRTDIFVDDAMRAALRRLTDSDGISLRAEVRGEIEELAEAVKPIGEPRGVMLAAAADGSSGATAHLLAAWQHDAALTIVFTGYVTPNTPAERLVKSGRAHFVRWNVHPRLSDTIALVRNSRIGTVIPAFCDRSHLAALAGAALAPARELRAMERQVRI